jgi:hypothetical protein
MVIGDPHPEGPTPTDSLDEGLTRLRHFARCIAIVQVGICLPMLWLALCPWRNFPWAGCESPTRAMEVLSAYVLILVAFAGAQLRRPPRLQSQPGLGELVLLAVLPTSLVLFPLWFLGGVFFNLRGL